MAESVKRKGFRLASLAYFLSLGALSVSLLAYFSLNGTFAWFGLNKRVDANGMAIAVKKEDDVNITLTSYRMSAVGTQEVVESSSTPHALNRYDQVFTSDNVYCPVILKLELNDGTYSDTDSIPLKIHHDASKDHEIVEVITDSDASSSSSTVTSTDDNRPLSSYISSVILVEAAVYNGSIDLTSVTNFKRMVSYFQGTGRLDGEKYSSTSDSTFVTYEGSKDDISQMTIVGDKKEEISITGLTYQNAGTSEKQKCTLYIYLNYNEDLIEYYIDQMKGSTELLMEANFSLLPDIDYISIKKGE